MPGKRSTAGDDREAEKLNREFDDLLQELRVSQNGTQILFAFLLTVPFSNGFQQVTTFQKAFYFTALILAALSAAMLIAPAVMHRVLFHDDEKRELLVNAARVALGGQALLTLAVGASVFLIGDYLYGHPVGVTIAVVALLWYLTWFFGFPLVLRRRQQRQRRAASASKT